VLFFLNFRAIFDFNQTLVIVGVPKESTAGETRVALFPDNVGQLVKAGHSVLLETGAGDASAYLDASYEAAGAKIVKTAAEAFAADLVVKVQKPSDAEIGLMKEGTVLVSFLWALFNADLVEKLKAAKITAIGMDAVPRITRAQKMDALSSMSSIAGYKAVLMAADTLGKYMPMLVTAAGTVPPAKAVVLGAGVAGLQAIATARRLGAVVEASDVRPAVKEQVESLGGKYIDVPFETDEERETAQGVGGYAKPMPKSWMDRQAVIVSEKIKAADVVITTALIPGRPAPKLISAETMAAMKPGSVIVDLAAEQGGNCALTQPGKTITVHNVTIVAPLNVPALLPFHASQLYSKNIKALLDLLITKEGKLNLDFTDEIIQYSTITHAGEIISPLLQKKA
jgi:NAD(P) transhydrogenase subunit alpha